MQGDGDATPNGACTIHKHDDPLHTPPFPTTRHSPLQPLAPEEGVDLKKKKTKKIRPRPKKKNRKNLAWRTQKKEKKGRQPQISSVDEEDTQTPSRGDDPLG